MTSFGAARALIIGSTLLGISMPLLGGAAESGLADRQLSIVETIQRIQARDGPNSFALLEPLTALILLHLEDDLANEAAALMDRAIQIVRINRGLHTLDEAPLIWQLIDIEERRGNHAVAWKLEQDLLDLLRRHPDDLRAVPYLREIADDRLTVLRAFLNGEKRPQVEIGCFYKESVNSNSGNCASGSAKTVVHGLLSDAQSHYSEAIAIVLRNGVFEDDALRTLEMDLLRVVARLRPFDADPRQSHLTVVPRFASPDSYEPWRSRSVAITQLAKWTPPILPAASSSDADTIEQRHAGLKHSYYRGRQILRRIYAYAAMNPNAELEQPTAMVLLADWELMYSRRSEAMERYEKAHAMLSKHGAATAMIEQLFAPATPIVLPAFEPNPLVRDEARGAIGHVDIRFEIAKNGRARGIAVVGSENATDMELARVERLIAASTFRPRVIDRQFAESAPVLFRYYLHERAAVSSD
jgi:hypothetical protein